MEETTRGWVNVMRREAKRIVKSLMTWATIVAFTISTITVLDRRPYMTMVSIATIFFHVFGSNSAYFFTYFNFFMYIADNTT